MDPKGLNQPLNIQSNHKQSNERKKFVICGCLLILLILVSVVIGLYFDTIPIRHEWSSQQIDFNYNCNNLEQGCGGTSGAIIQQNGYFWTTNYQTNVISNPNVTYNVSSFNITGSPLQPSTLSFSTEIIPNRTLFSHQMIQSKGLLGLKSVVINDTIYSISVQSLYSYNPIINNDVSEYMFSDNDLFPQCMALNQNTDSIYIILSYKQTEMTSIFIFDVDSLSFTHFYHDVGKLSWSGPSSFLVGYSCIFDGNSSLYTFGIWNSQIFVIHFDNNNTLIDNETWTQLKSFNLKYPLTAMSYAVTFDHNIVDIIGLYQYGQKYDEKYQFMVQRLNLKESKVTHSTSIGWTENACPYAVYNWYSYAIFVDYQYNKTYLMLLCYSYPQFWKVYYGNPTVITKTNHNRLAKEWNQFTSLPETVCILVVLFVWIIFVVFVWKTCTFLTKHICGSD